MDGGSRLAEAASGAGGRQPAPATAGGVELLGRDAELERLTAALAGDRWITVVGEAGIGKTSLIRAAVQRTGRTTREGGAFATLAWMPYLALRRALGPSIDGDAAGAAGRVEHLLGPDLLVLDDLQWADPATLATLGFLGGRIQLVVAVREGDPGADAALAVLESAGADVLHLSGLPDLTAGALLQRSRGDLGREAIATMIRRAGGNPLLLEEMARSGEAVGVLGRTLEARRERLSPAGRRSLDLLALAQRPLAAGDLEAVPELLNSGLVRRREGDLEIRHALLAEGVRSSLDDQDRTGLHAAIAGLVADPAERARHLLAAGQRDDAEAVVRSALPGTAEPRALSILLTTLAEATGTLEDRTRAAVELVALSDFHAIVALTDVPLDPTRDDHLEAIYQRANALDRVGRGDEAWELANRTLELNPNRTSPPAARIVMLVGIMLINHKGDPAGSAAHLDAALATARPGTNETLNLVYLRETCRLYLGEAPNLDLMRSAVEESFSDRRADVAGRAKNLQVMLRVAEGAIPALDFALDMARRLEAGGFESPALDLYAEAAGSAIYAGRFQQGVTIADDILDRPGSLRGRLNALLRRADALTYLGRFDLVPPSLAAASALPGDRSERSELLMAELELAFWSGATSRAATVVDELSANGSSSEVNLILPYVTGAWVDLELGRPIRDVPVYELRALAGIPREVAGIRALAAGAPAEAVAHFRTAAEMATGFLAVNALHCRWAAAEAERRAGNVSAAIESLRAVEDAAATMQFVPLIASIRRSLRLAGVRVRTNREAPTRIGLSARETQVVALVDEGLSNIEIARRLGLGRPTVTRMLSSAMGKLGVTRRTELAARELV